MTTFEINGITPRLEISTDRRGAMLDYPIEDLGDGRTRCATISVRHFAGRGYSMSAYESVTSTSHGFRSREFMPLDRIDLGREMTRERFSDVRLRQRLAHTVELARRMADPDLGDAGIVAMFAPSR